MRKNGLIYLIALSVAAAVKIFGSATDSDLLAWILTPVAWWVTILSGISFQYAPHVGYVSHAHRFIIASSCASVRFLLLTFLMLVFSFTHLLRTQKGKALWFAFSAGFSYLATIFVNGIRITIAICLPEFLEEHTLMPEWLTAKNLHTMIGTAVYFSFLFVIYFLAGKVCADLFGASYGTNQVRQGKKFTIPVFWYVVTVLVIPFLGRLYHNQWTGFGQYVLIVTGMCAIVVLFWTLITRCADA